MQKTGGYLSADPKYFKPKYFKSKRKAVYLSPRKQLPSSAPLREAFLSSDSFSFRVLALSRFRDLFEVQINGYANREKSKARKYEMMFVVLISLRLCAFTRGFYSPPQPAGLALFRDMSQIPENAE